MEKGKPHWWDDAVEFLKQDDLLGDVVRRYPDGSLEGKGEFSKPQFAQLSVSKYQ